MRRVKYTVCLSLFILLTGCWNKTELTEFGFVQAVAVDQSKNGKIELATHIYTPAGGGGGGGMAGFPQRDKKGVSIRTKGDTLFEAVRDIPSNFGRKAKWDHIRTILIGEDFAKKQSIPKMLDYFMRDHEPRESVYILIAKGKAADALEAKPFIESTIGQQIRQMVKSVSRYSAKTSKVPLLEFSNQLQSEVGVAMAPYIYLNHMPSEVSVAGVAVIKQEKMVNTLISSSDTESLLMLLNQYENGVIEVPCKEREIRKESLEVLRLTTKLKTTSAGSTIAVQAFTKLDGSVGALHCSDLSTKDKEQAFADRVEKTVVGNMKRTVAILQKEQLDLLGIGNTIYRKNPKLWFQLKEDWDTIFAQIHFDFKVEVHIRNTGLDSGKPFSQK